MIRWSALVSGCYAGAIFIDLCLIKRDLKKRLRCSKKRRERDVCVGAKSKRLVERYGLYILVGDDEVVRNE